MATIAKMVAQIEADNSGFKKGLEQSARYAEDFSKRINQIVRASEPRRLPVTLDTGLADQLREEAKQVKAEIDKITALTATPQWGNSITRRRRAEIRQEREHYRERLSTINAALSIENEQIERYRDERHFAQMQADEQQKRAQENLQRNTLDSTRAYVQQLQSMYRSSRAAIARDQATGVITPQQAAVAGRDAAVAYSTSLEQALQTVQGLKISSQLKASLTVPISSAMREVGRIAAVNLGQGIEENAAAVTKTSTKIQTALSRFGVAAAFGIEQLLNSSEKGIEKVLRAVSQFGLALGPKGIVVSALAVSTLAVINFFKRVETQAKETAKTIADTMRGATPASLAETITNLQLGDRFETIKDPTSDVAKGVNGLTMESIALTKTIDSLNASLDVSRKNWSNLTREQKNAFTATVGERDTAVKRQEEIAATVAGYQRQIKAYTAYRDELIAGEEAQERIDKRRKDREEAEKNALRSREKYVSDLIARYQDLSAVGGDAWKTLLQVFREFDRLSRTGTSRLAGESNENFDKRIKDLRSLSEFLKGMIPTLPNFEDPLTGVLDSIEARMRTQVPITFGEIFGAAGGDAAQELFNQFSRRLDNINFANTLRKIEGKDLISVESIQRELKPLTTQLVPILRDMRRRAVAAASLATDPAIKTELENQIKLYDQMAAAIANVSAEVDEATQKMAAGFGKVANQLRSFADFANILGNSTLGNILNSLGNVSGNISSAIATPGGLSFTNSLPIIGSALGAITGILGIGNKMDEERNKLLRSNNDRIAQLNSRLRGFVPGAASNVIAAAGAIPDAESIRQRIIEGLFGRPADKVLGQDIIRNLGEVGLTFQDLRDIAKEFGFELEDSKGRLIVEALDPLREGLRLAAQAAFAFSNSLADQESILETRRILSGQPVTELSTLQQQIELLNKVAPNLIEGLLNIDVSSAAGRDALRSRLQSLFERLVDEQIPIEKLGGFQSIEELIGWLNSTGTALNAFDDALRTTTESLQNVPQGFRLAFSRYQAQDTVTGALSEVANLTPRPYVINVFEGAIKLDANEPAEKLGPKVLSSLQAQAQKQMGDSTRWAELQ